VLSAAAGCAGRVKALAADAATMTVAASMLEASRFRIVNDPFVETIRLGGNGRTLQDECRRRVLRRCVLAGRIL
jgi:hypothetical protein